MLRRKGREKCSERIKMILFRLQFFVRVHLLIYPIDLLKSHIHFQMRGDSIEAIKHPISGKSKFVIDCVVVFGCRIFFYSALKWYYC